MEFSRSEFPLNQTNFPETDDRMEVNLHFYITMDVARSQLLSATFLVLGTVEMHSRTSLEILRAIFIGLVMSKFGYEQV